MPAVFATPHDLVFDDDPIDDVVYRHKTDAATPANVLTLLLAGEPVTKEMGPALSGIFSSNRELLDEVRTARGDDEFGELLGIDNTEINASGIKCRLYLRMSQKRIR